MSRVTGLWSWDFFKESSDHAMLFLLIMAEGSGVPECCIIVILKYLLVLMILLLGVLLIGLWSCSALVGLCCCWFQLICRRVQESSWSVSVAWSGAKYAFWSLRIFSKLISMRRCSRFICQLLDSCYYCPKILPWEKYILRILFLKNSDYFITWAHVHSILMKITSSQKNQWMWKLLKY